MRKPLFFYTLLKHICLCQILPSHSHKAIVFPKRVCLPNKTNGFGLFQKMFTVVCFLIGHSHTRIELSLALGLGSIPGHPLVTSRPRVPRLFYDDLEKKKILNKKFGLN